MTTTETEMPRRVTRRNRADSAVRKMAVMPAADDLSLDEIDAAIADKATSRVRRQRLARQRRQMLLEADNPFINERPGVLPQCDWERDREHVYHWTRISLHGEKDGDRSNLAEKRTGHLRYEPVKIDLLPEDWQAKLRPFVLPDGQIGYRDVRLERASRRVRDMRLAAMENEADMAADRINGRLRAEIGKAGLTRGRVEEDLEELEEGDVREM